MAGNRVRMMRDFKSVSKEFRGGRFKLQTVGLLIVYIREHSDVLSTEQAEKLLQIPADVLEYDVEEEPAKMDGENGRYLAGNIPECETCKCRYLTELRSRFRSGTFRLADIAELTRYVMSHWDELRDKVDFLLRVPEVFLDFEAKLTESSDFKDSGDIYADHINKVMGLQ